MVLTERRALMSSMEFISYDLDPHWLRGVVFLRHSFLKHIPQFKTRDWALYWKDDTPRESSSLDVALTECGDSYLCCHDDAQSDCRHPIPSCAIVTFCSDAEGADC